MFNESFKWRIHRDQSDLQCSIVQAALIIYIQHLRQSQLMVQISELHKHSLSPLLWVVLRHYHRTYIIVPSLTVTAIPSCGLTLTSY